MNINALQQPIRDDLELLDDLIRVRLASDVPLIQTISQHLVNSGGKRLRPTLGLLMAGLIGSINAQQRELALIIEFIHTATLLHDDVVDESDLRRGNPTANALWGNQASVLVGDFLLARSFQLLVGIENMVLMDLLASTTQIIASGEVLQLENRHNPATTIERYLKVIEYKTATLFAAASKGAAILAGAPGGLRKSAYEFGLNVGLAFQLIDDALDYSADSESLGKNIGDDLAEGKPTLPLLYALQQGSAAQQTVLQEAIAQPDQARLADVLAIIEATDAIGYTKQCAADYAHKANACLAKLPRNAFSQPLADLCEFALVRDH